MSRRDGDSDPSAGDGAEPSALPRRDVLKGLAGAGAIAGGITGAVRGGSAPATGVGRYVVGIDPGHSGAAEAASQAQTAAVRLTRTIDLGDVRQVVAGWYSATERDRLRDRPAVAYVEPEQFREPHRPTLADAVQTSHGEYPWGIEQIGAHLAHDEGYTGEGADIAIIDTGADPTHASLADNVGVGGAFGDGDCVAAERQYETVDCGAVWDDDLYHGTHVAGSAAAVDRELDPEANPGVDVERIAGVAPGATIHVANVFEWFENGEQWELLAPSSNTAAAIQWTADQGYDVANASLGGPTPTSVIEDALAYAVGQHDVVVVASAGNAGERCGEDPYNDDPDDCVSYPAAFGDAIAVGNLQTDDTVNSTSSRGPEVDVAAPGTAVLSVVPSHMRRETNVDNDHWWLSGTSMASPHVAGLAALLAAHTDLDNEEIKACLRETAEDIGARDVETGAGPIDATAAFEIPNESLSVSTLDPSSVDSTEATLEGELLDLGGADTAEVSFEYWPEGEGAGNPQETAPETLDGSGEFATDVSGLDPATTYVFRAAAETESESASGAELTFTTGEPALAVETGEAVDIGQATATLRGEVLATGGAETVAASFEYWVEGDDDRQETLARTLSGSGSFEITVENLAPETTYRFRALAATDGTSDAGEETTFTTEMPPLAVETGAASNVGQREATLAGEVTELGVATEGEVFFEYWVDGEGDGDPEETAREPIDAAGTFDQQVTELEPGTTYAFRAAAETPEESDRGTAESFTTEHLPLSVETGEASDIGPTSATLSGELLELGAADAATVAFEYWADEAEGRQETPAEALSAPGTVTAELTGLRQDTAYAFRALADSGIESDAGEAGAFATPIEAVSRPTVDRTDVDTATFSKWGEGYRIRAAGTSPWQRPRDHHGYGAIYAETQGDVVVQTTLAGLRGEHDLRVAGLVMTNDILAGGGLEGDVLLAVEPDAGVSLAVYNAESREYETVGSASQPPDLPVDLRLTKRDGAFVAEYRRAIDRAWQSVGSVDVPAASFTQHAAVFATGGHETDGCVADFAEFLLGETGVSLLPAVRTVPPAQETTFDLVVDNADRGIRSYSATLAVPDPDLLVIEEVHLLGDPVFGSVDVRSDGSQATIEAGMGENAHDPGDVAIAEVTVRTRAEGSLSVEVPEVTVVDDGATIPYDIASVDGADVTIAADAGPPPVVGDDPPRDLDGDGLYRDIDGDGAFTIGDVQALFHHRRDDVVLDNAEYFNFAGNDPPEISLVDVQVLFQDLVADDPEAAAAVGLDVAEPGDPADLSLADLKQAFEE